MACDLWPFASHPHLDRVITPMPCLPHQTESYKACFLLYPLLALVFLMVAKVSFKKHVAPCVYWKKCVFLGLPNSKFSYSLAKQIASGIIYAFSAHCICKKADKQICSFDIWLNVRDLFLFSLCNFPRPLLSHPPHPSFLHFYQSSLISLALITPYIPFPFSPSDIPF